MSAVADEFELGELRAAVRGYLERHVAPLVDDCERERRFPWEVLPPLHEFGYVGGLVAPEDGGDGISFVTLAILMEDMRIERMFRDARETSIPEGSSELQTLTIGKELLGVSALR